MELTIKGHDLDLSDALKAYTERRLRFSLGGFAKKLQRVEVRLSDINGPRGGIDKSCAITAILRQLGVALEQRERARIQPSTVRRRAFVPDWHGA